ncbi:MAG: ATP-binding protein [Candidatus Omnitrophica bacterium]|nr:ATP-binding protein [Candidatus Omnitrophota bacterium]MDD5736943.1 ATP-binding protein [Candidatus Omnitrophota bacterium]
MVISVASGKGGTGKTTIAVNMALSIENAQLIDCDVEEPNAHIFVKPEIKCSKEAFLPVPEIDKSKCVYCGKCREVCSYNAIAVITPAGDISGNVLLFPELCHSCGACVELCPAGAIREVDRRIGMIEIGDSGILQFAHGRLDVGQSMSPPLIRQLKEFINPTRTVIIDAPPGTSCPVITAIKGSDYCILVTEPTPFGLNDLILAVETVREIGIPYGVIINRSDIGDDNVSDYCEKNKIRVLSRIPFDKEVAVLYSKGKAVVGEKPLWKDTFRGIYNAIKNEALG